MSALELILVALETAFRCLNGKGDVCLPKLFVDFIGVFFAPRLP